MIARFSQTGRQPNPDFVCTIGESIIFKGRGVTSRENSFIIFNNAKYEIVSDVHSEDFGSQKSTQVSDIISSGNRVGYVYPSLVAQKKVLFLSIGYDYFEYSFYGRSFKMFEVALGDDQHYFCVYENGKTIAIIHRSDRRINFKDNYVIYAQSDVDLLPMSLLTLYIDSIMYPDFNEHSGYCTENIATITTQQELIDKYDPDFIPRIVAMENNSAVGHIL